MDIAKNLALSIIILRAFAIARYLANIIQMILSFLKKWKQLCCFVW